MTRLISLALSLMVAVPLAASDNLPGDRRQELRNVLIQDCGSCHGLTMHGGLGPALVPDRLAGKSIEYLSSVILNQPGARYCLPPKPDGWQPSCYRESYSE
jgi:cytochrome c55X